VRTCLLCDELLDGPEVYRIRIGGVAYEETEETMLVQFIQQPGRDYFQDGSTIKWLCNRCARSNGIETRELDYGSCKIHGEGCGLSFEEWDQPGSDCVLEVERGVLHNNASGEKGPPDVFITEEGGCVHFNCACQDPWRLPLCDLRSPDTP